MSNKQITLNDGRKLGYEEYGSKSGSPILLFHGSPGSRYESALDKKTPGKNTRLIAVERPGYGLSDAKPNRTILDWTNDVEELLNALGLAEVDVIGVSGGAPYALATGAKLGSRINRVVIVCGMGPLNLLGSLEGISDEEKTLIQAALYAPDKLREQIAKIHAHPESLANEAIGGLPDFDKSVITPELVQAWLTSVHESTKSTEGMVSDYQLFNKPWGFTLDEITVPVHFFHGDQDTTVTLQHPHYLVDHIHGAKLEIIEGAGHLGTAIIGTRRAINFLEDN